MGPDPDPPPSARLLCSPETVYGWAVEDSAGSVLGTVSDILLDMAAGRVAYVLVATGGFAGRGQTCLPLAWDALEPAHDGGARLVWNGQGLRTQAQQPPGAGSP